MIGHNNHEQRNYSLRNAWNRFVRVSGEFSVKQGGVVSRGTHVVDRRAGSTPGVSLVPIRERRCGVRVRYVVVRGGFRKKKYRFRVRRAVIVPYPSRVVEKKPVIDAPKPVFTLRVHDARPGTARVGG